MTTREYDRAYFYCIKLLDLAGAHHESVYETGSAGVAYDEEHGYEHSIDAGEIHTREHLETLAQQVGIPLEVATFQVFRDGVEQGAEIEVSMESLLGPLPLSMYSQEEMERLMEEDMRACEEGYSC